MTRTPNPRRHRRHCAVCDRPRWGMATNADLCSHCQHPLPPATPDREMESAGQGRLL